MKESDYDLRLLIEGVEVTASAFFEYRAEVKNPLPMIYQSGYLTIKDYDRDVLLYTLGFPNDEVCYGFLNFLVPYYTGVTDDETGFHIAKFMRELRSGDVDAFMERLKVFFAGIPYELSNNTERHYQPSFMSSSLCWVNSYRRKCAVRVVVPMPWCRQKMPFTSLSSS